MALVTITMGERGAYASLDRDKCLASPALSDQVRGWDPSQVSIRLPSMPLSGATVNSNGGGDAFCAGIIVGLLKRKSERLTLKQVVEMGLLSSLQRVDSSLRDSFPKVMCVAPPQPLHSTLNPQNCGIDNTDIDPLLIAFFPRPLHLI